MKKRTGIIGLFMLFLLPTLVGAEEIIIVGTGSGPVILEEIGKVFSQQNPDVKITLPKSIGSGGGIKAVGNDEYQLARVAREIKDHEKDYNLTYTPIARVPIVFFVHPSAGVQNLSNEQVCGIYSGKIYNWQEVGGHKARIRVIRRQEGDSSLSVLLESFPNFKDITITEFSKMTYSDPDTIELTENTADSIAFGSYADVKGRGVVVLNIDDVSPADTAYPYYGTLALVYKEKNRTGKIKQFIDFAISPIAADSIKNGGGLPLVKETH